MDEQELKDRTKRFALRVMKLVAALPNTVVGRAIGGQLVRSGTSVGANYRAACRGRSKAEFLAKLGIVEEEADECAFWMELIIEDGLMDAKRVQDLHKEASEITAIMAASRISASGKRGKREEESDRVKEEEPEWQDDPEIENEELEVENGKEVSK